MVFRDTNRSKTPNNSYSIFQLTPFPEQNRFQCFMVKFPLFRLYPHIKPTTFFTFVGRQDSELVCRYVGKLVGTQGSIVAETFDHFWDVFEKWLKNYWNPTLVF